MKSQQTLLCTNILCIFVAIACISFFISSAKTELSLEATAPSITSLSVSTGSVLGETPVTIIGTGFMPGTVVTFGGVPASHVTVVDADTINLKTPAYVSGSLEIDVLVTNSIGSARLVGGFVYTQGHSKRAVLSEP